MSPQSVSMNVDSGEKTWLTPPEVIRALGRFTLDPCCPPVMPWRTADTMLTHRFREEANFEGGGAKLENMEFPEFSDGLLFNWSGHRVWCNPPYGRDGMPFIQRMAKHAQKETGGGILLVFARTDTAAWQDWIFPYAYGAMFMRGRMRFHRADGSVESTATAPSALVAYSTADLASLRSSGIPGAVMEFANATPR